MIAEQEKIFTLYILRCGDGKFYIGITSKLEDRMNSHKLIHKEFAEKTRQWTKYHQPVELVFTLNDIKNARIARRIEKYLKVWTKDKKERLVSGDKILEDRLNNFHLQLLDISS